MKALMAAMSRRWFKWFAMNAAKAGLMNDGTARTAATDPTHRLEPVRSYATHDWAATRARQPDLDEGFRYDESSEAVLQRLVENCAAAPELSIVRRAESSP